MTRIFKHTITESGEDIILFFKGKDRFDYFLNKSKEHLFEFFEGQLRDDPSILPNISYLHPLILL